MARPKKRKLPPGVTGMAEWKEAKRLEQIGRNARALLALPEEERRRQLMAMIGIRFEIAGVLTAEKKPGEE